MHTLNYILKGLSESEKFAHVLAQAIMEINPGALLFFGDVGAGKTTLTRSLVAYLPGGLEAEVASPSFTICNIYCTAPLVHHYDLYRLDPVTYGGLMDESLEESLDDPAILTIVEWAEHIPPKELPADGLICRLWPDKPEDVRHVELTALGPLGVSCLDYPALKNTF